MVGTLERNLNDVVTSSAVRYVVLGCGAVGGTVAAGLARDGHEVLACDADPAVVSAVAARGLRIEGPVENFTAAVPAVTPADLPARIDGPVLVAVKAHHTAAAVALLAGRLQGDAFAVALQNGLTGAILAAAVGPERVVEAVVNFGADTLAPGVVLRGNRATFLVGEPDGTLSDRVRSLAADIADATATPGILGYKWAKQVISALLAATAVSDLPIADVLDDPAYRPLLTELARQVIAQAPFPPAPLDGFDPTDLTGSLTRLARFNRASAKTRTGIYRDLAVLHRPTEAPAILGGLTGTLPPRVVELVQAIERGRRSCARANLDLLAAYERAERVGRPLNAVVTLIGAPERAATGPLAGRPVAVKDIIEVAGVPTRCGSPASGAAPAPRDATVVARLRAAGAEVFATSQCLEYAAGFAHPDVGDTRNPRDPSRTSGGSSGGSAALVAAGVCDLALGTDTGGSVRIPAAYCGIAGLKPTHSLLPVTGVFPLAPACDHVGTLTATVPGAAELLAALADPGALAPAGDAKAGIHDRRAVRPAHRPLGDPCGAPGGHRRAGLAGGGGLAAARDQRPLAGQAGRVGGHARGHRDRGGGRGAPGPGLGEVRRGHPGPAWLRRVRRQRSISSSKTTARGTLRRDRGEFGRGGCAGRPHGRLPGAGTGPAVRGRCGLRGEPLHRPVQPDRPSGDLHPGPRFRAAGRPAAGRTAGG